MEKSSGNLKLINSLGDRGMLWLDIYHKFKWFFMILTRQISIKINEYNYQYFDNYGYDLLIGNEVEIPVELLSKGSHYKIECQCDSCGVKKQVIFKNYVKYGNEWGVYFCRKCSEQKRKKSLLKSHGCEYPIQNKRIYRKIKETIQKKKNG